MAWAKLSDDTTVLAISLPTLFIPMYFPQVAALSAQVSLRSHNYFLSENRYILSIATRLLKTLRIRPVCGVVMSLWYQHLQTAWYPPGHCYWLGILFEDKASRLWMFHCPICTWCSSPLVWPHCVCWQLSEYDLVFYYLWSLGRTLSMNGSSS